jgi:hypothetical protein
MELLLYCLDCYAKVIQFYWYVTLENSRESYESVILKWHEYLVWNPLFRISRPNWSVFLYKLMRNKKEHKV